MIYIKIAWKKDPSNWYLYSYNWEINCTIIACHGEKWGKYDVNYKGTTSSVIDSFASRARTAHWIVDVLTKDEAFLEML